ncbi:MULTISPECIES: DUF2786 domain-containing protein [Amycolatopsis]|uniref:DUF2786 domain-containing protein n=1 Tax=Amycolatopsis albidoflavus TaxID=102226 RepID=A0ABW5I9B8_9PSEU
MPDPAPWQEYRRVARKQGVAPALKLLPTACRDGAIAAVPAGELPAGTEILREADLPGGAVAFARGLAGDPAGLELVWVRLGLSQGLLDECLRYLGERRSGEESLLRKQMIQDCLASALNGQLAVEADLLADGSAAPARARYLHQCLSDVDRKLLGLLGAKGFLAGGPGEIADVSELLASVHEMGTT